MKQWTKNNARTEQIVDANQFNEQHRSFRGQMTGLDRAQYPEGCVTQSRLKPNAMHKCWVFSPWSTGVTAADGEQTVRRAADSDTLPQQWRALNYVNYTAGFITVFETTLEPFKGGNLFVEWYGNAAIQQFWGWTNEASYQSTQKGIPNDKFGGLRILLNGVVVVERIGPAKPMDCFSISGAQQLASGPVTLTCQWNPTGAGPDDPIDESLSNKDLMQAHLFGNRIFAIGRWR